MTLAMAAPIPNQYAPASDEDDDWRRLRYRAGWGLDGVLVPPSWPDGRPEGELSPSDHTAEAGWLFGATGPSLGLGWLLRDAWSLQLTWRPHAAWLDVGGSGQPGPVLWNALAVGIEVGR